MLYIIGNAYEIGKYSGIINERVLRDIGVSIKNLEYSYGMGFDYTKVGGYSVIVDSADDITAFSETLNIDLGRFEWIAPVEDSDYVTALFVVSNDFTVTLYLPKAIAPKCFLDDYDI